LRITYIIITVIFKQQKRLDKSFEKNTTIQTSDWPMFLSQEHAYFVDNLTIRQVIKTQTKLTLFNNHNLLINCT
ncbi:MAG: hypothetical protein ACRDE7_08960, partial [Sphingobacterium sp.]